MKPNDETTPESRPRVVVHVAVSLDGASSGFEVDLARFYTLAGTWAEDVTLTGADTVLAQEQVLAESPRPGPAPAAPLLAVVDARARVRQWEALRDCGYWSGVIALRADSTPAPAKTSGRMPVPELRVGADRVDLGAALAALRRDHGARLVRVDSGGELTGALLGLGLVDELSLLVHPCLAGPVGIRRWHGRNPPPALALERLGAVALDGGLVWLRYRRALPASAD